MELFDKLKDKLSGDSDDHSAPEHLVTEGPVKDWRAVEFTEDDLVDDDWIKENTKEVE